MDRLTLGHKIDKDYIRTMDNIDPDEHILTIAYQHPFGIIIIYLSAFVCFIGALAIMSALLPSVFSSSSTAYGLMTIFALVATVIVGIILSVATYVYKQSRLTVTDRNVIQVLQQGVMNRKISQISLANVEDVTSHQKGFLANMFNFGTLKIETAGEQVNFVFNFCPESNRVAKIILDAKDDFLIATGQAGSYRNSLKAHHYETSSKSEKTNIIADLQDKSPHFF